LAPKRKAPRAAPRRRKPKEARAHESGRDLDEVYAEIRPTPDGLKRLVIWPSRKDLSDADVVSEAGGLLWQRALRRHDDSFLAGAARIFHTVWIMLRSRDEDARAVMLSLERDCIDYRERRYLGIDGDQHRDGDAWSNSELPPRAGLDRAGVLYGLIDLVNVIKGLVQKGTDTPHEEAAAIFFVGAVARSFPHVVIGVGRKRRRELEKRIAAAWRHRARRAGMTMADLDARSMILDGFAVLGVSRGQVNNWLKGVPV
jgi:hypothetical protein